MAGLSRRTNRRSGSRIPAAPSSFLLQSVAGSCELYAVPPVAAPLVGVPPEGAAPGMAASPG